MDRLGPWEFGIPWSFEICLWEFQKYFSPRISGQNEQPTIQQAFTKWPDSGQRWPKVANTGRMVANAGQSVANACQTLANRGRRPSFPREKIRRTEKNQKHGRK
jgi:hypothetical protein